MPDQEIHLSFSDLLLFPVSIPVKGFMFILEQLRGMVDEELFDETTLQKKLMEVQLLYEQGELDEETYTQSWEDIRQRLMIIAQLREEMAEEEDS